MEMFLEHSKYSVVYLLFCPEQNKDMQVALVEEPSNSPTFFLFAQRLWIFKGVIQLISSLRKPKKSKINEAHNVLWLAHIVICLWCLIVGLYNTRLTSHVSLV